jgi:hypothetical protein
MTTLDHLKDLYRQNKLDELEAELSRNAWQFTPSKVSLIKRTIEAKRRDNLLKEAQQIMGGELSTY